jgi:DNA-binding HxlR family transcriptional regulator
MLRTDFGQMHCSIARAGQIVGESWTPLILRDLLLGFRQFEEIRENLGISTNVLTERLRTLVDHDVVARAPYGDRADRFEYTLTEKGRDAISVVLAMLTWGDRWEAGRAGPPTEVLHHGCGQTAHVVMHCSECGEEIDLDELTYHSGPGSGVGPGTHLLQTHLEPPIG